MRLRHFAAYDCQAQGALRSTLRFIPSCGPIARETGSRLAEPCWRDLLHFGLWDGSGAVEPKPALPSDSSSVEAMTPMPSTKLNSRGLSSGAH